MRTFILRTMQAMLLFSICLLVWYGTLFFNDFILQPITNSQQQTDYCGTPDIVDNYVSEKGVSSSYKSINGRDGKALFNANCASCHKIDKDLTGPALQGVEERWPDRKQLYSWIRNSDSVIRNGNKYANALVKKYGGARMSQFPNLSDEEIEAILLYLNYWQYNVKRLPVP